MHASVMRGILITALALSTVLFAVVYARLLQSVSRGLASPYTKADIGRRFWAVMVDALLVMSTWVLFRYYQSPVFMIVGILYIALKDSIGGRSVGKFCFGLVVVDLLTGRPCGRIASVKRNILFLVPGPNIAALFLESMTIVRDPQGQRLGDRLAYTQVVAGFEARELAAAFQRWWQDFVARLERTPGRPRRLPVKVERNRGAHDKEVMMGRAVAVAAILIALTVSTSAQSRLDKNVVYGMYSGAAMLLDVHYPATPNGFGVIFIAGSGWNAPLGYSAPPLKQSPQVDMYVPALLQAGYTVFALTHRATPTFRYPAPLEDVQRAVRFIRHNAKVFAIDAARIGGMGGSSGAHLVSLLATMDGTGETNDPDPVNRESAKLQCAVARAAPTDLTQMGGNLGTPLVALLLGARVDDTAAKNSIEYKSAYTASPINHVSADDPPMLLIHGDADRTVPFHQSESLKVALEKVNVPVKLLRIEGADHGPDFPGAKNPPDYKAEMVKWFDTYLRKSAGRDRSGL